MPGKMVTFLLGAQGGDEEAFACLYAVTNPVLVRYLRAVSDADPAPLALNTWASLLDGLSVLDADDDDDWTEVAVGTAREWAVASGALRSAATPVTDPGALRATDHEPDPVDAGVAMLHACPPAVADVLAMGVVAGLGRDSIARITGLEPTTVFAHVHAGQDALGLPLETLSASLRVPGNPSEVADLPAVMPLFTAQSHAARPARTAGALAGTAVAVATPFAVASAATTAVATAAAAAPVAAPASAATVVDLLTWNSPTPATSRVILRASAQTAAAAAAAATPSKWTTVGAGVAAWSVALGGIGAAATMSGFLPSVIDGLFGDQGRTPVVVAQGPRQPGGTPSPGDGGVAQPRPSGQQPGTKGTVVPAGSSGSGGAVVVSAVSTDFGTGTQVVVPAVLTNKPSPSTPTPTTPTGPSTPPPTTSKPPTTGGGTVTGAVKGNGKGHAYGKGHAKHSTGQAKGRSQVAKAAAKAQAAAARAQAKATKAAKAVVKAKAAKAAKAKASKAKSKA